MSQRVMNFRLCSQHSMAPGALIGYTDTHDTTPMGSSLKLCLVAEGAADIYPRLGPTCLWDTGAAQAVVEQAGGQVETLEGEPLDYATPHNKLNPYFVAWGCRPRGHR